MSLRHLDLTTLRSLVTIVEAGGITRAANQLHLTQSAVSMQLKRLEDSLGVPVFDRIGRGLTPTPNGEQLLRYARRLLAINDEALDRLTTPTHEGELNFGVPCDIVHPYIPAVLKRFCNEYPRVNLRLTTGMTVDLKAGLRNGLYDIILTTEPKADRGGQSILRKPLVWTGAHLGRAHRLRPLPIMFTSNCMFREPAIQALDKAGIDWVYAVDTDSEDVAIVTVAADLGVRADITLSWAHGLEPIEHGGELPKLPPYSVVMYLAKGDKHDICSILGEMLNESFSE